MKKGSHRVRMWPGPWCERNPSWTWESSSRLLLDSHEENEASFGRWEHQHEITE